MPFESTSTLRAEQLIEGLALGSDEPRTLQSVVDLAVSSIGPCDWAGVTVVRGRRLSTEALTSPVAARADQLQYELDEGPCIDAAWHDGLVLIDDVAAEERWPTWTPAAYDVGIRSVLSVHLATGPRVVGGLNLYSGAVHAFGEDDVEIARAYGAYASAALTVAQQLTGLQRALQSRHVIGAAQGVLRARHGLTLDQAFEVLVRVSRDNNLKLRDLAEEVVVTTGLPARYVEHVERGRGRA